MAKFEFRLPDIGEGITEGEVVAWHVKEGERVSEDQLMVEIMTDKATVTIGAPRAGRVERLCAEIGKVMAVGEVLVVIDSGNGASTERESQPKPSGGSAASAVGNIQDSLPGAGLLHSAHGQANGTTTSTDRGAPASLDATQHVHSTRPLATPAVRKLARELGVDLSKVAPSGQDGRVTREDVEAHLRNLAPASSANRPGAPTPAGTEKRIPFVGMRRRIAERMRKSRDSAAHFTFVEECEVDTLLALRKRLKPEAERRGVELTYLPFVIKAVVAALAKHPALNGRLDEARNEIVIPSDCNIGIAAATEQGLLVPVIHRAQERSLLELASEIKRLSDAARAGSLTLEEMSGSTFTVTSLGKQAGLFAVPIINYPNIGILGIHRIKERPVVRDGQIVIGNVMLLSLSLDHRLVDGHEGAAFAYDVIHYLEDPARLLLDC